MALVCAFECPVCLEEAVDPKILPCHHSICLTCARTLLENARDNKIKCPQCRIITAVKEADANNLKDDFRMVQFREALNRVSIDNGNNIRVEIQNT